MIHDLITLERPLISVDLETTGIYPNVDRIVQIGLLKLYPDGELNEWETLIDPDIHIPDNASAVHHITDATVKDAPYFKDIAPVLYKGFQGCDFCGYNCKSFDIRFFIEEFRRCGINFVPGCIVDSFLIFKKYSPRNLSAALKHYTGKDLLDAHSALADARASMQVLREQLLQHKDLPRNIAEIERCFKGGGNNVDDEGKLVWKNGEVVINFGAKAGTTLKQCDPAYLQWILRSNFSAEVKAIITKALAGKYPTRSS